MIANPARGEVIASVSGRSVRLCLTLGGLAALQAAFARPTLEALAARLERPSADDLAMVLAALCMGEGNPPSPDEVLGEPEPILRAAAEAFRLAFEDPGGADDV